MFCVLCSCLGLSLCVRVVPLHVCDHAYVDVCICVCGLCKMRMSPPQGGGCTDHFQSRQIFSPARTKCSRQSAGRQCEQSLSKAMMCFEWSAAKRRAKLRLYPKSQSR